MFRSTSSCFLVFQLSENAQKLREKSFHKMLEFDRTQVVALDEKPDNDIVPKSLWNTASLLRDKRSVRTQMQACVVGGSSTIRRIWHDYGRRPNVVFVPDNVETPSWCFHDDMPSLVVKAPPVMISKELLHSQTADAFAAEFPLPALPPLENLVDPTSKVRSDRILVLDGVRNTFNLGGMLKSAKAFGFNTVVSQGVACDFFSEHAIRTSGGCGFDGAMKLYSSEEPNAGLLQLCCSHHKLLPVMGVPSKEASPLFSFAEKFHSHNLEVERQNQERLAEGDVTSPPIQPLGTMIILSGDPESSQGLLGSWGEFPMQAVQVQMDGPIDSINVMSAGNIVLHHFRKGAQANFSKNFERNIKPVPQSEGESDAGETVNDFSEGAIESPTLTSEELAKKIEQRYE